MRIVAGQYRGKKLWAPEGKDVRPTSERTREAVFNILYSHTDGNYGSWDMADIYAGTGAFGFEALSRGFNSITFVDIDIKNAQRNAKLFPKEGDKLTFIQADATQLPRPRKQYHLVFTDAPYALGLTEKTLQQLLLKNWLCDGALCIVEVRKDERWLIPDEFELLDERVYGLARVLFLRKK
jgi:16S rRNA (guanine966-N2)-methyltransferase